MNALQREHADLGRRAAWRGKTANFTPGRQDPVKKVLFGSNYPAWPAKDCLEDFESLNLDEATAKLFLYENAERVFRGDKT